MKLRLIGLATGAVALLTASAALAGSSAATSASVTIIHVQKGCHVWKYGAKQSPTAKISLARGARLVVVNQDIDGHKLVELGGPARLKLPAGMKMNGRAVVTFAKAGVYRLGTKSFEVMGMPEVKTAGEDNVLRLTVSVK